MGGNAGAVSSPKPELAPTKAADTSPIYYLLVIGPPELFHKIATTPSDPEVIYVEEATQLNSDGRRERLVMTGSKAAIRRFKAAAKKLGMEVRGPGAY